MEPGVIRRVARWPVQRVRRYHSRFDHVGLAFGVLFFAISLTPSLLPRTWLVQGLLSGISATIGYALGTLLAWPFRRLIRWRPSPTLRTRGRWVMRGVAAALVVTMLVLGSGWQNEIRDAVHYPEAGRYLYTGVFVVALFVVSLLVGIGRLIRRLSRRLATLISRWLPLWASRGIAAGLTALVVAGLATNVIGSGLVSAAEKTFQQVDEGTYEQDEQPTSALRSGGPGSLVDWDTLGLQGRAFVANGPDAADITSLTGRPALEPIRVYAGRDSSGRIGGEADLVLAELKRTHAFDRAVLAIGTSTGSGWLEPWETGGLEYLFGGNTAIASLQYSYFPSWISFLLDKSKARLAGQDLFDAVYAYWATLPAGHRPKLVVFGESLGAFGGSAAFPTVEDLLARTDGALFTGTPNETTIWRTLTDARAAGSPEREPVWHGGTDVRFASDDADLRDSDGQIADSHVIFFQHASDPIVWWSPDLLIHRPDWLEEPRGSDVVPAVHYFPLVTFWQVTCDMIGATDPPAGFGHTYGPETIDAWISMLHPAGWTDALTQRLIARGMPTSSP